MEKKDYYHFKDILFGLRNEYQKIEEKLRELKQFAELDTNNTKAIDYFFYIYKLLEGYTPKIKCELVMENQKKLIELEKKNLMFEENRNPHIILDKYPVFVRYNYQDVFEYKKNEILNSEFTRKICMNNITKEDFYQILELYPESLNLYDGELNTRFNYYSHEDIISMTSDKYYYLSNEVIEKFLNIKLSKSIFSEYHQNIIETSNTFDKNIKVIGQIEKTRQSKLKLEEDDKQLVLIKK